MNNNSKVVQQIQDVVDFLEPRMVTRPEIGIILGSDLGAFVDRLDNATRYARKPAIGWENRAQNTVFGRLSRLASSLFGFSRLSVLTASA